MARLLASAAAFALRYGFIRYLTASGATVLAGAIMRHGLGYLMPYQASVTAAYLLSIVVGWYLTKILKIFPDFGNSFVQDVLRSWPVMVLSLLVLVVIASLFREIVLPMIGYSWRIDDSAYIIGMLSTPVPNYLAMRWLFSSHQNGVRKDRRL